MRKSDNCNKANGKVVCETSDKMQQAMIIIIPFGRRAQSRSAERDTASYEEFINPLNGQSYDIICGGADFSRLKILRKLASGQV